MSELDNLVSLAEYRELHGNMRRRVLNALEASRDWLTVRQVRDLAAPLSSVVRVNDALELLLEQGAIEAQRATQSSAMLYRYAETDR